MKNFKEYFLKLNTYEQIQMGIITVSLCILMICVFLLSIISLILINTTYLEIKGILEFKENDQINAVSIFVDSQISITSEIGKLYEYSTRSYLENNLKYPEFLNNFNNPELYKNYISSPEDQDQNKLLKEKCFIDPKSEQNYQKKRNIFSSLVPIFEYSLIHKYYRLNQTMFKSINYFDNKNKCLIYYLDPKLQYRPEYDLTKFNKFLSSSIYLINEGMNNYIINYNIGNKKQSIVENFRTNPLILGYMPENQYYKKQENTINLYISSINFYNFTDNAIFSNTSLFTLDNVENVINYDYQENLIENIEINLMNFFSGFTMLVNQNYLNGIETCKILQQKYFNFEKILNETLINQSRNYLGAKNDSSCFFTKPEIPKFEESKDVTYYSTYVDNFKNKDFRRFVKIPIANDKTNRNITPYEVFFKILKFQIPDITTRLLLNSFFSTWMKPSIILLKSYKIMENYFHKVYKSFTMEILRIFSLNIIISILTSILIIIITFKVSKSIGNPIKKLKETVIDIQNNINNEKTEDAKDKEKFQDLNSIKYEDDYTINKFLEICKKLIKGGFTQQENFNEDKRQIDNAYNNISYMKMNNLIVQEEKIMEETNKKVHTIFSYDSIINEIRTDTYKNDYTDCKNLNLIYKNNNNNDDDNIDNCKKYEIEDFLIEIETIKKKNRRKTNSSSINNEKHPKKFKFYTKINI